MILRPNYRFGQVFSFEQVAELHNFGKAVSAAKGGLLIGPSHDDFGIKVLMRFRSEYRLVLEVEGGEYWLNPLAASLFIEQNNDWNNSDRDSKSYTPIIDQTGLQVIDCTLNDSVLSSKFLLTDSRAAIALINKHSTSRYLDDLEELNWDSDYYYSSEPEAWSDKWANMFHGLARTFRDSENGAKVGR